MAKIIILNSFEQKAFDRPPIFTEQQQQQYFQIPTHLQTRLRAFESLTYQVGFILLWGYCQASGRFFQPSAFRREDITMVCKYLGISSRLVDFTLYNQRTFNYHKQLIRQSLKIQPFDLEAKAIFHGAIGDRVSRYQQPSRILKEVSELLQTKHIEVPGYNRFALAITEAINNFDHQLNKVIRAKLSVSQQDSLDQLLEIDQSGTGLITRLKTISHSRKPQGIRHSIQDFQHVKKLYQALLPAIQALDLHDNTLKHYATWVRKASLYQIKQLAPSKRYLYILSFIVHQYRLRQDILVDILLASVQHIHNTVEKEQKNHALKETVIQKETLNLLSKVRISYKALFKQIDHLAKSKKLSDEDKVTQINILLDTYHQQAQPLEDKADVSLEETKHQEQNYYDRLEKQSLKLQIRVADILRHLSFDEDNLTTTPLGLAILYYQKREGDMGKRPPMDFLNEAERAALQHPQRKGRIRISLYKALLCQYVAEALKSGTISPFPAYRYLSLEHYLYPQDQWAVDKQRLLEELGLSQLLDSRTVLKELSKVLDASYKKTNQRLNAGKNPWVKFDQKGKLVITTPKVDKIDPKPVSTLLKEHKDISILQVLSDIQTCTDYLSCFRHHSVKDKKHTPSPALFQAAILGWGCNIGITKMANVSKGINEDSLTHVSNWHMSLDNIHAANQKILDLIEQLGLSKLYHDAANPFHTAGDGRKVGVSVDSMNANPSFKYYGKGIGVTLYSCIDPLNRVFYTNAISSSEREAAYVVDSLMHNLAIKSTIHSTDTHGYSETVFGVLHLLGIYFAPRIKGLKKATLYGFKSRKAYEEKGYKVVPQRYINEALIEQYWDDILRLIVTIKRRDTSASLIFKRLSSYAKQHPLYCALKEFGRIIKSNFILHYIDQVELRQAIEKQLNRIELSNKFSKAIHFGNNQEIQYSSKEEQELVVACQAFIQNAIVLWNELYLSQKILALTDPDKRNEFIRIILQGTFLLWVHINFQGEYDFTQNTSKAERRFNMEEIITLKAA